MVTIFRLCFVFAVLTLLFYLFNDALVKHYGYVVLVICIIRQDRKLNGAVCR